MYIKFFFILLWIIFNELIQTENTEICIELILPSFDFYVEFISL
jgi:hypothetical protein